MSSLNTIRQLTRLGLGCSTFGGSKSKKTALHALEISYERGINYYDVARSYGYGQAECILGEFAKGKRDRIYISTKFGISPPRPFPLMNQVKDTVRYLKKLAPGLTDQVINSYSVRQVSRPPVTPDLVMRSLEKSLRELRTDYVDFFLLHDCPYGQAAREDVCDRLEKAKDAGKVKGWGATCEDKSTLSKFFSAESPFKLVQFPYSSGSPYLSPKARPDIDRIVFSVMSHADSGSEPAPHFFRQLPINQIVPGMVQNLREAWLYIALQELKNGVVLCSMTQANHIERNFDIFRAPGISASELFRMKQSVLTGRIVTAQEVTPASYAGHYPFQNV